MVSAKKIHQQDIYMISVYIIVLISRETCTVMYYCLQAYWLAKVRPNQTEEACARLAVSLDRLQNIEEVVLATRI